MNSSIIALSSAFFAIFFWQSSFPSVYQHPIGGETQGSFSIVKKAFEWNFAEGLEREGASVAVYHNGQLKVHLWGGHADSSSDRLWRKDTTSMLFSSTKAVAALCVALLVDRGKIRYDDFVVKYWPEYGQEGKNGTTIEDVLTHKAGLPYLDERIHIEDVGTERIKRKLERAVPAWIPGTASGYHAVTFGFILDELFKKIDGRNMATFFREEIAEVYDLDVSIGLSPSQVHRAARLTLPSSFEYLRDVIRDPRLIAMLGIMHARFDGIIEKIVATNSWINFGYDMLTLNDPDVAGLPLPAVTGVATADSLARLFSILLQGGIISNTTLSVLNQPTLDTWHIEKVVLYPLMKGHGFFYEAHPTLSNAYTFGHPGYGGQMVHVDPINNLVFVYISNGLKTGSAELCYPCMRLLRSVYQALPQ